MIIEQGKVSDLIIVLELNVDGYPRYYISTNH